MRALPDVSRVTFDIPTEVFSVQTMSGATERILSTIRGAGYEPDLLPAPPGAVSRIERLASPRSKAVVAALSRARARGVPLILDFWATWCGLCKKFEQTTLADPRVVKLIASNFELLKIDVDEDPEAAEDLNVKGIPDVWILDGDGLILARENRYMDPDEFLAVLQRHRR